MKTLIASALCAGLLTLATGCNSQQEIISECHCETLVRRLNTGATEFSVEQLIANSTKESKDKNNIEIITVYGEFPNFAPYNYIVIYKYHTCK